MLPCYAFCYGNPCLPTCVMLCSAFPNSSSPPPWLRSGVTDQFSGRSNATQALAEFQHQGYSVKDLAKFLQEFNLPSQVSVLMQWLACLLFLLFVFLSLTTSEGHGAHTLIVRVTDLFEFRLPLFMSLSSLPILSFGREQKVRNVTGDGRTVVGHTEANLDVQYIMALGQLIPTDFFVQKGNEFDLLAWSQDVAADPYAAMVWSVSYGEDIETVVSSFDATYPQRLNTEVAKLGTIGKTVLFASGDSGVYSRQCK